MYETSVAIIGVGIVFFLGIIATHMDQEHALLKMFFLIMGLWFGVGLLNIAQLMVVENGGSAGVLSSVIALYWALMMMSVFTTFYFVLYYVKLWIETIKEHKSKKRLTLDNDRKR